MYMYSSYLVGSSVSRVVNVGGGIAAPQKSIPDNNKLVYYTRMRRSTYLPNMGSAQKNTKKNWRFVFASFRKYVGTNYVY